MAVLSPRCGKPMTRYEAANGPMLDDPACGRPEGHPGPCRSRAAVTREYAADVTRLAAKTRPCGCGCGDTAGWGHGYLRGHNPRSARGSWAAPVSPVVAERNREQLGKALRGEAA